MQEKIVFLDFFTCPWSVKKTAGMRGRKYGGKGKTSGWGKWGRIWKKLRHGKGMEVWESEIAEAEEKVAGKSWCGKGRRKEVGVRKRGEKKGKGWKKAGWKKYGKIEVRKRKWEKCTWEWRYCEVEIIKKERTWKVEAEKVRRLKEAGVDGEKVKKENGKRWRTRERGKG